MKKKKGFEVELWDAIAEEAGFEYKLQPMGMGEMLQAVESGKLDVAIAGITVKGDRVRKLDFAIPYYDTGLVLVTAADNQDIQSTKDLDKKKWSLRESEQPDMSISADKRELKRLKLTPILPKPIRH